MLLGRAAQFILALATVRIATTILSPAEMGRVSLMVATTGFFIFLLINPVGMFINRRLHTWQAQNVAHRYLFWYGGYLVLVAIIAALCLFLIRTTRTVDFGLGLGWQIALVCGSLVISTINSGSIPLLNLLGYSYIFIGLSIATVAASLILAASFVLSTYPSAQYWLLGIMTGQAAVGFWGVKILFSRLRESKVPQHLKRIRRSQVAKLFGFAWPVSVAAVLGWMQSQGYRYLLGGELGLKALGLFVVGYGISMGIIAAFESVITAYFQPGLYRDASSIHEAIRMGAWGRYAEALIPSLMLTTALIIIVAPELARLFLGMEFQSAAVYVIWGALADAMRSVAAAYSLIAHVRTQTKWLLIPNIVGAALSVGMCLAFIPRAGASGVGLALTLSGAATVLTMHLLFSRHSGKVELGRPILIVALFAIVLWATTFLLRSAVNVTAWWSSIAILSPVCFIFLLFQYFGLRNHIANAVPQMEI